MKTAIILTADGSHSIAIPELHVNYHSVHGAVQESRHVFIEAGLHSVVSNKSISDISIFEMGFGTGLNALLTAMEANKLGMHVSYVSIDQLPLDRSAVQQLNHGKLLNEEALFGAIHNAPWNREVRITSQFTLEKQEKSLETFEAANRFHLIYFDAFAPAAQPHLWEEPVFRKLFNSLHAGGVLVTYCSKSIVRKAMQAAGFEVTRIPGPHGKRHMVRAFRAVD